MPAHIGAQERLPAAKLARLENGEVQNLPVQKLFGGRRVIVVGVPGAFTPVCTRNHIPRFVKLAPSLKASGFDMIACVAANDPWTVDAWSKQLDPAGRLHFFSDSNLDFGRAAGLATQAPELFLRQCLERFVMTVSNCVVEKISVERSRFEVSCTSADLCVVDRQTLTI